MISTEESLKKIHQLFSKECVVNLERLLNTVNTNSRVTVFRRLKQIGYFSSYTHAGRFYTLTHIPQFDADGLWTYKGIRFSEKGTLKETVLSLIKESEAGQLQVDLENRLGIKVHNTLLDLVNSRQIKRKVVDKFYLYLNPKSIISTKQISKHKKIKSGFIKPEKALTEWVILEVLAEAIRGSYIRVEITDLCSRLTERHIEVTESQVKGIFKQYGIKKNPVQSS